MRPKDETTVRLGPAPDPDDPLGVELAAAPVRAGAAGEQTLRLPPAPPGGPIDEAGAFAAGFDGSEPSDDAGTDLLYVRPSAQPRGRPAPVMAGGASPGQPEVQVRRGSATAAIASDALIHTPVTGIPLPAHGPANGALLDADVPAMARAFVADAERRVARGDHAGVIGVAATLRQAFHRSIESPSDVQNRALPWVNLYDGESRLALDDAEGAIDVLRAAVDGGDGPLRARASWTLGRALFAAGRRQAAESPLLWGMQGWTHETRGWSLAPPVLDQVDGLRILAELATDAGDHARAATLVERAVTAAREAAHPVAVALAHQAAARCARIRGRCAEGLEPLRLAIEALGPAPPPPAIAAVLLDVASLQAILGRYGSAMEYVEAAGSWAAELPALAARAALVRGEVAALVGLGEVARAAVAEAAAWIEAHPPRSPEPTLGAGRVLCELGRNDEALALLDQLIEPEPSPAEDPLAQVVALRARAVAPTDPATAIDLATAALARKSPLSPIAAARIRLDAARALVAAGNPSAGRSAAKRGVKALQKTGSRGLKLELLLIIAELGAEPTAVAAIARTADGIRAELPPVLAEAFSRRPAIRALTSR